MEATTTTTRQGLGDGAASAGAVAVAPRGEAAGAAGGGLAGLLRALGPGRIAALGAVAAAMLGFFAFVAWRVSAPEYTLLFAGLQLGDSQQLVRRLEELGVPYRLGASGDAIMVPRDEALRLRMSLAEEGLPLGGTLGYELLDRAGPFGTSEFQAAVNLNRAVEGELARSIGTLRQVRSARVHLNVPKRELFATRGGQQAPAASVVLALRGGASLDKRQASGIRHLVAAAVPGLAPERVTLVDDAGNLLAQAAEPGAAGPGFEDAQDYRAAYEDRLRAKIVQLLERTLGPGRADAQVSADIDLNEVATTAETFDPDGQVVRSTQTTQEKSDQTERAAPDDAVSVANNLPAERAQQGAQDGAGAPTSAERSDRTEETVNYEISRTVRNETRRGGALRRLSIAVQVDGEHKPGPDGAPVYEPRSPAELEQLAALVRGAAGLDEARGDRLEIASRRFVRPEPAAGDEPGLLDLGREEWWRAAELGTLAALTLMVLLFGVRPVLRRVLPPREPAALPPPEPTAVVLGADGKPLLVHGATWATIGVDSAGNPVVVREPVSVAADAGGPGGLPVPAGAAQPAAMLDLRNVKGQVRASLVEDVGAIVDERAEEAVRVIRGWLHAR
jgi:flagellar M-ring protein FliF